LFADGTIVNFGEKDYRAIQSLKAKKIKKLKADHPGNPGYLLNGTTMNYLVTNPVMCKYFNHISHED